MSDEERDALITRLDSATTSPERDAALEQARDWLGEHPADERVATTMQRLEERDEKLRDPESGGWKRVAAVAALFSAVALATFGTLYALSGRLVISVVAGVVLGLEITWWTWEATLAYADGRGRNRNGGQ